MLATGLHSLILLCIMTRHHASHGIGLFNTSRLNARPITSIRACSASRDKQRANHSFISRGFAEALSREEISMRYCQLCSLTD
jgi:hypothetical protein